MTNELLCGAASPQCQGTAVDGVIESVVSVVHHTVVAPVFDKCLWHEHRSCRSHAELICRVRPPACWLVATMIW